MQAMAIDDPDPWLRRRCLGLLDHHANDASTEVFRRALHDPVPPVREVALHGLACERCRSDDLCVPDVVQELVSVLEHDSSGEVRYKALAALVRFIGRDAGALTAIRTAAVADSDGLVREAAGHVVDGRHLPSRERLRRRATSRRGKAQRRASVDA